MDAFNKGLSVILVLVILAAVFVNIFGYYSGKKNSEKIEPYQPAKKIEKTVNDAGSECDKFYQKSNQALEKAENKKTSDKERILLYIQSLANRSRYKSCMEINAGKK